MKRVLFVSVAASLLVGVLGASAGADQHIPLHPHMLVLGIEFDGDQPVSYDKCIDLAANNKLPLTAHHSALHVGTGGAALAMHAGHVVVPGAPVSPWANCEELIDFFFPEG
jgi:hypothetical protein